MLLAYPMLFDEPRPFFFLYAIRCNPDFCVLPPLSLAFAGRL